MERYRILSHKADLKIKAFGKTKKELFLNMLRGMFDVLKEEKGAEEGEERKIDIESDNLESLLVDFLNEALYLSQVKREAYRSVEFKTLTNISLKGTLLGERVKGFDEDIKAATYHDLKIKKRNGIWEATVLFDV